MIVSTEQLEGLHGQVAMVSGGFDPLHDGHVAYFTEGAALGVPVLCNVNGDAYVSTKHPPLLLQDERARVIDALRPVSYTHVSDLTTHEVLERLRPRYFVKGIDWEGRLPAEEVEICRRVGAEIVFLRTVLASSSQILSRWTDHLESRSHGRAG